MRYFLVVANPRTGSTLLVKALKPYCAGELWTVGDSPKIARLNNNWVTDKTKESPVQYMKLVYSRGFFHDGITKYSHEKHDVFGAKIHQVQLEDMEESASNEIFEFVDCCVFLRRKNLTEQAISKALMIDLNNDCTEPREIEINELIEYSEFCVKQHNKWINSAKDKSRILEIWYEDLDRKFLETANRVRSFIGLPLIETANHGMKKRRSSNQYREMITNYDEVVDKLGEKYGVPFGEPGNRWEE